MNFNKRKIRWTKNEALLRDGSNLSLDWLEFETVNDYLIRYSIFGAFIDVFNKRQKQDKFLNENKLGVLDFNMKHLRGEDLNEFYDQNSFVHDIYNILKRNCDEKDVIDTSCFFSNVGVLKIANRDITAVDDSISQYKNLKVLILAGNRIREIWGRNLPRSLQFIELYANKIKDLGDFCKRLPGKLVHVGLKRNRINDASNCHLLSKTRLRNLRSLDLGENDICNLTTLLSTLRKLPWLFSLQLQGNPCSVISNYKNLILQALPDLIYLDNTEILDDDKVFDIVDESNDAAFIFTCHKLLGLSQPHKEKSILQLFCFEIHLPLMSESDFEESDEVEDVKVRKGPKKVAAKKKSGSSKKGKSKKSKASSPYSKAIHEPEKPNPCVFKTERFPWKKIIRLAEDALVVPSPDGSLLAIRDTFRTSINVKLVYLKIDKRKPGKSKKKNKKVKKEKPKKAGKKSKGSNKSIEKQGDDTDDSKVEDKKPAEIILQRSVLANFWCDLHSINWSDKTIDFFWSESCKDNKKGREIEGDLRASTGISGGAKSKKGKSKVSKKGEKSSGKSSGSKGSDNAITIHVGFGLKRCHF